MDRCSFLFFLHINSAYYYEQVNKLQMLKCCALHFILWSEFSLNTVVMFIFTQERGYRVAEDPLRFALRQGPNPVRYSRVSDATQKLAPSTALPAAKSCCGVLVRKRTCSCANPGNPDPDGSVRPFTAKCCSGLGDPTRSTSCFNGVPG